MTKIVDKLPKLLADSFPQKKDLNLSKVFVKVYIEGVLDATREQIKIFANEILEGPKPEKN